MGKLSAALLVAFAVNGYLLNRLDLMQWGDWWHAWHSRKWLESRHERKIEMKSDPRNFALFTGLRGDLTQDEIDLEIQMSSLTDEDLKQVGLCKDECQEDS